MNQPTPTAVLAWALLMCLPGMRAAQAHQHQHHTMQSPATAAAPLLTMPLLYPSAFGNYQPYADQPVQDWRKANATVYDIGGWRAYAKEIAGGQADDGTPAANPHAGHHKGHHMGAKP